MDKRQGTRDRQSDEGLEVSDGRGGGHWAHFSGAEKRQKIIRGFSWGPNEYYMEDKTRNGHFVDTAGSGIRCLRALDSTSVRRHFSMRKR